MKLYTIHLGICNEISTKFSKNKWKDIIDVEQAILSGVEKTGEEVKNKDVISGITKISKSLSKEDHA